MDAVGFGIAPRALRSIWCGGICPACRWNRPRVQGRRQSRGCRAGAGLPKGTVEVQRKMPGTGPAWALAHVCLKDRGGDGVSPARHRAPAGDGFPVREGLRRGTSTLLRKGCFPRGGGTIFMALFKFTVDKEKGSVIVYGCFISTVR